MITKSFKCQCGWYGTTPLFHDANTVDCCDPGNYCCPSCHERIRDRDYSIDRFELLGEFNWKANPQELISIAETARILNVVEDVVLNLILRNKLPFVNIQPANSPDEIKMIRKADIHRLIVLYDPNYESGKKHDSWISVTHGLKMKAFNNPKKGLNVHIWIHKRYVYSGTDTRHLYTYCIHDSQLKPVRLKKDRFTCVAFYDRGEMDGHRFQFPLWFDIMDMHGEIVDVRAENQEEAGICNAIQFLEILSGYDDWDDYRSMELLSKNLGVSAADLDNALLSELKGTGIIRK
jgi:hypothetical protein